jgi:hypothetical protein
MRRRSGSRDSRPSVKSMIRFVKSIILSVPVVALLWGAIRHDFVGRQALLERPSLEQPSLVADFLLTKYPNLPEQVVQQRVRELTRHDWSTDVRDCRSGDIATQLSCARAALRESKPFYIAHHGSIAAYGVVADRAGHVYMISYRIYPFAPIPPDRHTRILDQGHTMLTECVAPVSLSATTDDMVACITPVNKELSARAAKQQPVDTTLCAIASDPASFNNKLVRVRGEVSGNFEYSTIEDPGCDADLWFAYPEESQPGPPGLAAYVTGSAVPGGEDTEGKRVLPVPVQMVLDSNFKHFQALMEARVKADEASFKSDPKNYVFHCVTATFIARVDGVSPEVYRFHKKRSPSDHADYLGFGQMGLFDAQLVVKSVEGDAVLSACSK